MVQCRTDRDQLAEHGWEQGPESEGPVHPVLQVAHQGREGPSEGSLKLMGGLLHLILSDVALPLQQAPPPPPAPALPSQPGAPPPPPAPALPSQPGQVVQEEGQGHGQGLEDSLPGDRK